jgi:hypothetical protein
LYLNKEYKNVVMYQNIGFQYLYYEQECEK